MDPGQNPLAFLAAIPVGERTCLEQAFGLQRLLAVIGAEDLSPEDQAKLLGCISEETARRVVLGMLLPVGVSERSAACVADKLRSVSFLKFIAISEQEGPGGPGAEIVLFLRASYNCLSSDEFARLKFGEGEEGGPTAEQFGCLLANASDETLAKLFAMGRGGGGGDPPSQDIVDVIVKCGLGQAPGGGGGPPQLTQEQQRCITAAIGEGAFRELMGGQRPPTQEEAGKIQACGVALGPGPTPGPGGAGGQPSLTPQQLACITAALGEAVLRELSSGQRTPTPEELRKIEGCGIPVGPGPGGSR